ncbi:MAG: ferrous iron transport protein A [Aquificae bacterium]|nr:ferrous iron transport protein A [Aquificota bacterium]
MGEKSRTLTLKEAEEGKSYRIKGFDCGRELRCRLEGLGMYPGQVLRVLQNRWGPVLVEVMGRKVGIGRGQAEKILLEEVGPDGGE